MLQHIQKMSVTSASLMLFMLLSADFVFIAVHCVNLLTPISKLFNIGQDGGYSEIFQYIKFFWIIILLSYIFLITKVSNYFSWITVFIYLLCDDALAIHENLGGKIAEYLNFQSHFNLRPIDFGELIVSMSAGILLLTVVALSYLQGSPTFKKISIDLLVLFFSLAFFGVVVDMAHVAIRLGNTVKSALGIIEDGGEMAVTSLIFWYVFCLALRKGKPLIFEASSLDEV